MNSIIRNFQSTLNLLDAEDSYIIQPSLIDEDKPFISIYIPFCGKKENKFKDFIKKFHHFTEGKHRISIHWITEKVKSLFPLKDKNIYLDCVFYHGLCSWTENCIGESRSYMTTRGGEHNSPEWFWTCKTFIQRYPSSLRPEQTILAHASKRTRTRENQEPVCIAIIRPNVNDQLNCYFLETTQLNT